MLIHYLVTRNARDKIQVAIVSVERINTTYKIMRSTGQYQGKFTDQPIIIIEKGKSNRTPQQQAELEYKSIIKKYLDKGYKNIRDFKIESLDDIDDPGKLLGDITTDQSGAPKPMLAKSFDGVATSTFEHEFYGSTKIDGTRCLMH